MESSAKHRKLHKSRIYYCFTISVAFVALLWLIKLIEIQENISFVDYGVFPRRLSGLVGIIVAPLIHSDFNHLISNSTALIVLMTGILYFYKDLGYRTILYIWIISGIAVWIGARQSYHIGASGLIYGIASFMFFSGIIRKNTSLMAVSLLVVFLYGSMVWGIFPIYPKISWEYHLYGAFTGYLCAVEFKNKGPQKIVYDWELEPDDDEPTAAEPTTNGETAIDDDLTEAINSLTPTNEQPKNTSITSDF